eukprot:m.227615 g.227615  ORF g.227615 m.227615 type:complete len:430 (-) comp15663_c0_seq1:2696-3985(-)
MMSAFGLMAAVGLVTVTAATSPVPDYECAEQQRLFQEGLVGDAVWPGFYIICVEPSANEGADFVFSDGSRMKSPALGTEGTSLTDFLEGPLREHLETRGLRSDDPTHGDPTIVRSRFDWSEYRYSSRLFSTDGRPLESVNDIASQSLSTVYLFEGGQFLWPGFHIGYERNISVSSEVADHPITLVTLSLRPLVFRVKYFLSGQEAKHIVQRARKYMQPSMVVQQASDNPDEQGVQKRHQSRTSSNTGLSRGNTPTVHRIEKRAHEITRLPYELGEALQVVRYEKGEKYEAHRDFFHSNDYPDDPSMLSMIDCGARNRLSTLFWYLNTLTEGGETYFPRALNESGKEYKKWNFDYADCYRGLAVQPKQGTGVLFYSMLPNSELDERSLHGACPPRGQSKPKWGANQWTYNKPDTPNSGSCTLRGSGRSDL